MNLTKAPEKGLMYATYIDKMIFEPYCRDELTEAISEEKLLELHLFDQDIDCLLYTSPSPRDTR